MGCNDRVYSRRVGVAVLRVAYGQKMKKYGFPEPDDAYAWDIIKYGLMAFHVLGVVVRRRGNLWVTWTASRRYR